MDLYLTLFSSVWIVMFQASFIQLRRRKNSSYEKFHQRIWYLWINRTKIIINLTQNRDLYSEKQKSTIKPQINVRNICGKSKNSIHPYIAQSFQRRLIISQTLIYFLCPYGILVRKSNESWQTISFIYSQILCKILNMQMYLLFPTNQFHIWFLMSFCNITMCPLVFTIYGHSEWNGLCNRWQQKRTRCKDKLGYQFIQLQFAFCLVLFSYNKV